MPTSDAPLTSDPPPEDPPLHVRLNDDGEIVRARAAAISDQENALVERLMAQEALTMVSSGRIPDAAPGPSPGMEEGVRGEYEASEQRLLADCKSSILMTRNPQSAQTRSVGFYNDGMSGRTGIYLGECSSDMTHWKDCHLPVLAQNVHVLPALARMAGIGGIQNSLHLAALEAQRRSNPPPGFAFG